MGWFEVTCETVIPLAAYDGPDHFVVTYKGEVYCVEDDGGGEEKAGEYTLYRVQRGLALDYRQSLFEVFDAHSADLHEAYAALFNPRTDWLKDEVVATFEVVEPDLLVIDELILAPKWRGVRLGLLILRRLIDLHRSGCGLVVCQPYSIEGDDAPKTGREGTVKLRRYVKALGFKRVGKTPFYCLSTSRRVPRYEDLLQGRTTGQDGSSPRTRLDRRS
jgi:hypothetical protein